MVKTPLTPTTLMQKNKLTSRINLLFIPFWNNYIKFFHFLYSPLHFLIGIQNSCRQSRKVLECDVEINKGIIHLNFHHSKSSNILLFLGFSMVSFKMGCSLNMIPSSKFERDVRLWRRESLRLSLRFFRNGCCKRSSEAALSLGSLETGKLRKNRVSFIVYFKKSS